MARPWVFVCSVVDNTHTQGIRPDGELDITTSMEQNSSALASLTDLSFNALLTCLGSNSYEAIGVVALDDPQTLLVSPLSLLPRLGKVIPTTVTMRPCGPVNVKVVEVMDFFKCKLLFKYSIWPAVP